MKEFPQPDYSLVIGTQGQTLLCGLLEVGLFNIVHIVMELSCTRSSGRYTTFLLAPAVGLMGFCAHRAMLFILAYVYIGLKVPSNTISGP